MSPQVFDREVPDYLRYQAESARLASTIKNVQTEAAFRTGRDVSWLKVWVERQVEGSRTIYAVRSNMNMTDPISKSERKRVTDFE